MPIREVRDEPKFALATETPTAAQRRLAFAAVAVVFAAFAITVIIGLTAPFAHIPMRVDGFVPALTAIFFVNDLITAALLFAQFSIVRSGALLVIANGYLFTALMAIPFALTFPGAFAPAGLFGDVESAAWIYYLWHYGFPLAVIAYAILGPVRANSWSRGSTRSAICWSVVIVVGLVCGLTWLATQAEELLPHLQLDAVHPAPLAQSVTSVNTFICAIAVVLLYLRQRSVLDLWLIVVMCVWITELALPNIILFQRYSFGFYVGRGFSLSTSVVILIVLLAETTRLYARLAASNMSLQRERANRLMNLEAMASSIAHEVRQPLTAIAANGHVGLRLLTKARPDIKAVRSVVSDMIANGDRASKIFDNIHALLGSPYQGQKPVDLNKITLGVLGVLRGELKEKGITTRLELTTELPLAMGHKGQLEEVILNLVRNAIEAMDAVKAGGRMLRVRTEHHGDAIDFSVEDSGPGINPKQGDGIFEAFVTTKPHGMGLGLAICRMIIERHNGELSMSPNKKSGALFKFILPIKSPPGSTGASH